MRAAFKRNSTISQLLSQPRARPSTDVLANPVARIRHSLAREQVQTRDFFKFTSYFRKTNNGFSSSPYSLFSSALFSSSSSSSSSTGLASLGKVGFVGWYLDMVKNRPMLTKSITCCLIYIAADLSSQVI